MSEFGGFTPSIRWNNETGVLAYVEPNEIFEKEIQEIELNSQAATFVVDMRTIEKGKGRIATGVYKMFLVPLRQELPPLPSEELSHTPEYKAALGVNLWNPRFGLVRIETTSAYVRAVLGRVIQEYDRAEEAQEGLLPVIRFVGSKQAFSSEWNKHYSAPDILCVGWLPRERVVAFAAIEPTVPLPPPVKVDTQLAAVLRAKLEAPRREEAKSQKVARKPRREDFKSLKDELDDEIPPFAN